MYLLALDFGVVGLGLKQLSSEENRTMFEQSIFLQCNACHKPVLHPTQRLNFFSDYSHMVPCPHCRTLDTHFVKPLAQCYTRYQVVRSLSMWPQPAAPRKTGHRSSPTPNSEDSSLDLGLLWRELAGLRLDEFCRLQLTRARQTILSSLICYYVVIAFYIAFKMFMLCILPLSSPPKKKKKKRDTT